VRASVQPLSSNDAILEVIVGQSRILTVKEQFRGQPSVAIGDPSIATFSFLPDPRQIRVLGLRIGVTDLSIVSGDNQLNFEIRVQADLDPLRLQLQSLFPDASVKLTQLRSAIAVEGQVRDTAQAARMMRIVQVYMSAVLAEQPSQGAPAGPQGPVGPGAPEAPSAPGSAAVPGSQAVVNIGGAGPAPLPGAQIINLLKVPGAHQVLLKVRVAELNRTGMRQIGADWIAVFNNGTGLLGTNLGAGTVSASGTVGPNGLTITTTSSSGAAGTFFNTSSLTTVFGIFERAGLEFLIAALRQNSLVKILAEPNLVALNGQQASFHAGGRFPVPVAQAAGTGVPTVTVVYQNFGVDLTFTPYIQDDDSIRLTVNPIVSSVDFALGTVLVPGGTPTPGLDDRSAQTTVEMRTGQTLAIAGLLQLTLDNQTIRVPGLGDLPILGPFFSNTTGSRIEKELVVLVTPYLIEPMNHEQVNGAPGDEVNEPNDLEFYLLNRIEGRTGRDARSTTNYDDPLHVLRCFMKLERDHVCGPYGYSN
jgi:pilus assembly protein CpaC